MAKIGVIGGTGLYSWSAGSGDSIEVDTPFGKASGAYYKLPMAGHEVYFLPRHGSLHTILPGEVNSQANIYGFKKLGIDTLISISAVGSLKGDIEPGQFVFVDQYVDRTSGQRPSTFYGEGVVGHVLFADPSCASLRNSLIQAAKDCGIAHHTKGTYVCMEGPQLSTRAESHLYRGWDVPGGIGVVGMTAIPEAKLAREAGLCYQTVAMATDYDCWNDDGDDVTVEAIFKVLKENASRSRDLLEKFLENGLPTCEVGCLDLAKAAPITPEEAWPLERREVLDVLLSDGLN